MSSKETVWQEVVSRRAMLFGGINALMFGALASRLYYLQFIKSADYSTLAEGNRVKLQLVEPLRGNILDRNGVALALNEKNYRMMISLDPDADNKEILGKVQNLLPVSPDHVQEILELSKKRRYLTPQLIKDHLTWDELSKVEFHAPELTGVFIDVGQVRHYPFAEHAAHMTGYVGSAKEEEAKDNPLLKLPEFRIGKDGAEKLLEDRLRGEAGIRQVEVNVHNLPVRELSRKESIGGENIKTTIDSRLQEFIVNRLGEESGGVVVMNVHNGDILALVSQPAFGPNRFSLGITHKYWKELNANIKNPLLNKAVAGQYPPGSTFKMMTGLAALEAGVGTANSYVYCPGHFSLGNHRFNCWKPQGHGSLNIHGAIAQSCDTYFYTMGQRLGINRLAEMARKFGLGSKPEIALPNVLSGIMPDTEWKLKKYQQPWQPGDTISVAIGQGYVIATPLQLAVMTCRLVNGGRAVVPHLVNDGTPVQPPSLGIKETHLQHIVTGMNMVANHKKGTAYAKRIMDPRLAMGGKTGTAQVRKITIRGQDQDKLPWHMRHHALFVGYAPVDTPQYAVSVMIEHGGGGSATAAPIARDILEKVQRLEAEDKGIDLSNPPPPQSLEEEVL